MKKNDTEGNTSICSSSDDVSIPSSARKIVSNLKEIVNYPDEEIYAMLKECNMDPDDAIQRILSQDPFHEVKRRREKKKENKEPSDYKPRGTSSRGGRTGVDHIVACAGATRYDLSECGGTYNKLRQEKEAGINTAPSSSTFSTSMEVNSDIRRSDSVSDFLPVDSRRLTEDSYGGTSLSSQTATGYRSACVGFPGQPSMADIVRSGRQESKLTSLSVSAMPASQMKNANPLHSLSSHGADQSFVGTAITSPSQYAVLVSDDRASGIQDTLQHEPDVDATQSGSWSIVDPTPMNASSVPNPSGSSVVYADPNGLMNVHTEVSLNYSGYIDEAEENRTELASPKHTVMGHSEVNDLSHFDDAHFKRASYQTQELTYQDSQGLALNIAELQKLQLQEEESEDNMSVKMPNHLQDPSVDCSHLSFGSFGSGISSAFRAPFSSQGSKGNTEENPETIISSSKGEHPTRNIEYFGNDQPQATANEVFYLRSSFLEKFDSAPSESEIVKYDKVKTSQPQHYSYPSSIPNYALETALQAASSPYPYGQANSRQANLSALSTSMQSYGRPSADRVPPWVEHARQAELYLSSLAATQSADTRYQSVDPRYGNNTASNVRGPSIQMSELSSPGLLSNQSNPNTQTVLAINLQPTPAPSLHVPVQAHSQPSVFPVEHIDMLCYADRSHSFGYSPSTNSGQHPPVAEHGAGTNYSLPHYKNMSMKNSVPSSAFVAGYGGFEGSANFPRNFASNTSSYVPTHAKHNDILASQLKEWDRFLSMSQNESLDMRIHAAGSRSASALPTNPHYTLQGQIQESLLWQMRQISQQSTPGYADFYHPQAGVSLSDLEGRNSRGDLSRTEGSAHQSRQRFWAHGYGSDAKF